LPKLFLALLLPSVVFELELKLVGDCCDDDGDCGGSDVVVYGMNDCSELD
jgi:hypothetical protein